MATIKRTSSKKHESEFEVSHSKIKLGRRCLKAYKYRYIDKIQKRVKARPLIIGTLVHSCLESYFRNGHYLPEITKWKELEYKKMFKEEQALHADVIPLVKELIRGYIKTWKASGLEMTWVEKDFRIEIAPGIFLVGKIDGLAQDNKKFKWLIEHKTCKKMPGEEVRMHDTQAIIYSRALPNITGEKFPHGVVWDYLRTKLPAKPEVLKSGGLSTRKNIDTTREVYAREIRKHGYSEASYESILHDLDLKRDSFYRQVKLPFNKSMGDRVMQEVVLRATELRSLEARHKAGEDVFDRNLTRDCSWCDYRVLCHAELRGDDTDFILKHDYIVRVKHDKEVEIEVESSE